jgi:hypothetical protein
MSVNESGVECIECGDYNCEGYICSECMVELLAEAKAEAYKEILDDIEMHCTQYQWITKPDFTKRHYPFCPTDFYELKAKYLKSGQKPQEVE